MRFAATSQIGFSIFKPGFDDIVLSIMPDGKRTLVARSTGDRSSVPIDLVLNLQHLVQ